MSDQLSEEMNDLPKFVDTESYYFYSMFVVRNQTIPYGMQADVEFYDTDNNLLEGSEERMFMPVSTLKSQLPDDTYIDPNYLSDNDTVLLCATKELFVLLKTISTQAEQRHMTFLSIMSYAKPAVKNA